MTELIKYHGIPGKVNCLLLHSLFFFKIYIFFGKWCQQRSSYVLIERWNATYMIVTREREWEKVGEGGEKNESCLCLVTFFTGNSMYTGNSKIQVFSNSTVEPENLTLKFLFDVCPGGIWILITKWTETRTEEM